MIMKKFLPEDEDEKSRDRVPRALIGFLLLSIGIVREEKKEESSRENSD